MDGLVPGRIVYFVIDAFTVEDVDRRRSVHDHHGNSLAVGDCVPAMVTRVWDPSAGTVNLKLMLDGDDTYWLTSTRFDAAKTSRTWHWMFDGQATRHQPLTA